MLREAGFWRPQGAPASLVSDRPDPRALVDAAWARSADAAVVVRYLRARARFVEGFEMGLAPCRFAAGAAAGCARAPPRELGCASLTDGVFVWPEGLPHYLRRHCVRPADDFVAHVLAAAALERAAEVAEDCDAGGGGRGDGGDGGERLLWDAELRRGVPMPAGMAEYLRAHSTLFDADSSDHER
jgi:hypothetical protein